MMRCREGCSRRARKKKFRVRLPPIGLCDPFRSVGRAPCITSSHEVMHRRKGPGPCMRSSDAVDRPFCTSRAPFAEHSNRACLVLCRSAQTSREGEGEGRNDGSSQRNLEAVTEGHAIRDHLEAPLIRNRFVEVHVCQSHVACDRSARFETDLHKGMLPHTCGKIAMRYHEVTQAVRWSPMKDFQSF